MTKQQVIVTLTVFVLVAAGIIGYVVRMPQRKTVTPEERRTIAREKSEEVLKNYFGEQTKGNEGGRFFCSPEAASTFFAVRSWTIVDYSGTEDQCWFKIRIDSSNRGGIQITKIWDIQTKKKTTGEFCIEKVSE